MTTTHNRTAAAESYERQLRGELSTSEITWGRAWEMFLSAHKDRRSPGHLDNIARDVNRFIEAIGDLPLVQTTLEQFNRFFDLRAATSGRAAQLARSTLHKVAKWTRSRYELVGLAFLEAERPDYTPNGRRPATPQEAAAVAKRRNILHVPPVAAISSTLTKSKPRSSESLGAYVAGERERSGLLTVPVRLVVTYGAVLLNVA